MQHDTHTIYATGDNVVGVDEEYKGFCEQNNFVTKHNKPKFTAEVLYRFLTNDLEFEEEHTGLADVKIEKEILKECLRRNPSVNGLLWE